MDLIYWIVAGGYCGVNLVCFILLLCEINVHYNKYNSHLEPVCSACSRKKKCEQLKKLTRSALVHLFFGVPLLVINALKVVVGKPIRLFRFLFKSAEIEPLKKIRSIKTNKKSISAGQLSKTDADGGELGFPK